MVVTAVGRDYNATCEHFTKKEFFNSRFALLNFAFEVFNSRFAFLPLKR